MRLRKNADDFGGFFFGKLNELIVGLDGFERLEENGLAGGAGSVHHAGNGAALLGANGYHEAIVAESDVVFAGVGIAGAENLAERFLDRGARLADAGADAAKCGRGVVADFGVGKNRAANRGEEIAEIGERCGAGWRGAEILRRLP